MKRLITVIAPVFLLGGCATLGDPQAASLSAKIVETALVGTPAELQQAADNGNAPAQLSYSIVLRYGLNGVKPDAERASVYRTRATSSRGSTNTAVYLPDGKHSGHTQLISVPRYDLSESVAKATDDCAGALNARLKPDSIGDQCGGPGNYTHLSDLWAKAQS